MEVWRKFWVNFVEILRKWGNFWWEFGEGVLLKSNLIWANDWRVRRECQKQIWFLQIVEAGLPKANLVWVDLVLEAVGASAV